MHSMNITQSDIEAAEKATLPDELEYTQNSNSGNDSENDENASPKRKRIHPRNGTPTSESIGFALTVWNYDKLTNKTSGAYIYLDITQPGKLFEHNFAKDKSRTKYLQFLEKNKTCIFIMDEYLTKNMMDKYGFIKHRLLKTSDPGAAENVYTLDQVEWEHVVRRVRKRIPNLFTLTQNASSGTPSTPAHAAEASQTDTKSKIRFHPRTGRRTKEPFGYTQQEWSKSKIENSKTGGIMICDLETGKISEYQFLGKVDHQALQTYLSSHKTSIVLTRQFVSMKIRKEKEWIAQSDYKKRTKYPSKTQLLENQGTLASSQLDAIRKAVEKKLGTSILSSDYVEPDSDVETKAKKTKPKVKEIWHNNKMTSRKSGCIIYADTTQPKKLFEHDFSVDESNQEITARLSKFNDFLEKNTSCFIVMRKYLTKEIKKRLDLVTYGYYRDIIRNPVEKIRSTPYELTQHEWDQLLKKMAADVGTQDVEKSMTPEPSSSSTTSTTTNAKKSGAVLKQKIINPQTGRDSINSIGMDAHKWEKNKLLRKKSGGYIYLDKNQPGKLFEHDFSGNTNPDRFAEFLEKNNTCLFVFDDYLSFTVMQVLDLISDQNYKKMCVYMGYTPHESIRTEPYVLSPNDWDYLKKQVSLTIPNFFQLPSASTTSTPTDPSGYRQNNLFPPAETEQNQQKNGQKRKLDEAGTVKFPPEKKNKIN